MDALELARKYLDSIAATLIEVCRERDEALALRDAQYADAMIAHRWFSDTFGESFDGRDFAVKVPMAAAELAALKSCTHCGGPETSDKDCFCGGSGKRIDQIRGLYGCIAWWRGKAEECKVCPKCHGTKQVVYYLPTFGTDSAAEVQDARRTKSCPECCAGGGE